MSLSPRDVDYRQVIRYCQWIALIAVVSTTLLIASAILRYQADARDFERLERYQIRSILLSSEVALQVSRIQRILATRETDEDDAPGSGFASPDLEISVALGSIALKIDSIVELQERFGLEEFAGTVERARSRHLRLQGLLAREAPSKEEVTKSLEALAVAVRQLHQLDSVSLQDSFSSMTSIAERRTYQLAAFVVAVLLVTSTLFLRILFLIRRRLDQHRETEAALWERERQLQHGQKIQALGTLVSGVAHDFNNILTTILGNAQLLRAQLEEGDPRTENTAEIMRASERAASLTRQLLVFSRYEAIEPIHADLSLLIRDLTPMLRRLIRADVSLDIQTEGDGSCVYFDPVQIEQILLNLVTNACHALPDGGTITVSTAPVEWDAEQADRRAVNAGRYWRLRVEDDGCGMPNEVRSRALEPFYTTKKPSEGTGLGLSTVHGIVHGSGGHVVVESEIGRGTRVEVYLPLHEQQETSTRRESAEPEFGASEAGTILFVEDDDPVRNLTSKALRRQGYRVLACSSGVEALRVCREHPEPIDLLLTDFMLPGLRGTEIVKGAREIHPELAVVYTTGYRDDELLEKVSESSDPVLSKPFRLPDLFRIVHEQIHRADERSTTDGNVGQAVAD